MVWELVAYWLSGLQRQLLACPYTKEADRHDRERARYTVPAVIAKTVEASAREELSGRMPNDYLHGACREPFAQFLLVLRRLGDSGKGHLLSEHFIGDISKRKLGTIRPRRILQPSADDYWTPQTKCQSRVRRLEDLNSSQTHFPYRLGLRIPFHLGRHPI